MAATCSRAVALASNGAGDGATRPLEAADVFCRQSRRRVASLFRQVSRNDDVATYRLAQNVLKGEHLWLEEGLPRCND